MTIQPQGPNTPERVAPPAETTPYQGILIVLGGAVLAFVVFIVLAIVAMVWFFGQGFQMGAPSDSYSLLAVIAPPAAGEKP